MKKEIKQELEELESSLADHENIDRFKVNDDYFANMQESVLSKIDQQSKTNSKEVKVFNLKRILSIAAIFIIMIGSVFIVNQNLTSIDEANEITSEVLYDYLLDNIDDLDHEMFAAVMDDSDIVLEEENIDMIEDSNDYMNYNIEDFTKEEFKNLL